MPKVTPLGASWGIHADTHETGAIPLDATEHESGTIRGEIREIREFLVGSDSMAYSIEELTERLYGDSEGNLDTSFGKIIVTAYVNVFADNGELELYVLHHDQTAYYRLAD